MVIQKKEILQQDTKLQRNYAIELLRIVSMLMIVSLHFFSYNSSVNSLNPLSVSGIIRQILHSISLVSVNCYILISGYFLLNTTFKIEKLLKLILEVLFYSIVIYTLLVLSGSIRFSIIELGLALMPTLTREYWFVTSYVGVYLLSPILKKVIKDMDRQTHGFCLLVGFFLFVVYYNFFFFCDNLNFGGGTGIVWFTYLYFCGSYIYKYDASSTKENVKKYFLSILVALLSQVPFVFLYLISNKEVFLKGANIFVSVYNSIFVFISSILFFEIFVSMKTYMPQPFFKKIIIILGRGSLAVYLIHDNKHLRPILWEVLENNVCKNPIYFVIYWILTIITIYAVCIVIESIRQLLEKFYLKPLKNLSLKTEKIFKVRICWLLKKF